MMVVKATAFWARTSTLCAASAPLMAEISLIFQLYGTVIETREQYTDLVLGGAWQPASFAGWKALKLD